MELGDGAIISLVTIIVIAIKMLLNYIGNENDNKDAT